MDAVFFCDWESENKGFDCKNFLRKFGVVLTEVCVKVKPE
jgi:hypothetical protein